MHPFLYSSTDETKYHDFPYYFAGIDVTFDRDGTVSAVKINDKDLEDDSVYKVVFCNGDYTGEIRDAGNPVDTTTGITDLWMDYVQYHKILSPPEVLRPE